MTSAGEPPVLLFDDTCGMCAESVQFVLRHERGRRRLRFATLRGSTGMRMRARHPELESVDSVIWIDGGPHGLGSAHSRSAAVGRLLRYLGGPWTIVATLLWIIPRPLRDWGYDLVARHRHALFESASACLVPSPEQRARFLE